MFDREEISTDSFPSSYRNAQTEISQLCVTKKHQTEIKVTSINLLHGTGQRSQHGDVGKR